MKGLSLFIIDLRNSKDEEEEDKRISLEINNIQNKFSTNLNSYQKKKYLCKLIYIYLLGYTEELEFGYKEAYNLMGSTNYAEKQLGYLAISLMLDLKGNISVKEFLNDKMEEVNSILIRDLKSDNEDLNILAIHFVGSNFKVSDHTICEIHESDDNSSLWLEMIDIVCSFCISPIQSKNIKKKASLALLALFKLYPQTIITNTNWIPRLLTLLDDSDFGVVISSIPLIEFVASYHPKFLKTIVQSASNRLYQLIVQKNCDEEYYYHDFAAPWLVVKLLKLIEYCFMLTDSDTHFITVSDIDETSLERLRKVIGLSIKNSYIPPRGLTIKNSQSSILFEAVSLAAFLNTSPEASSAAIMALLGLTRSHDTNTRYLSLDALIKLTARLDVNYLRVMKNFDDNLNLLFDLLHDRDISVKRKSLDLIYTVCNFDNHILVVEKLLEYFPLGDASLKSELAIKVAVLAERFATDSSWYVTCILKLLSLGSGSNSNYIGNEVWERVIQIVVNNEELQAKSCRSLIGLLKDSCRPGENSVIFASISESLIKVSAFLLGEYCQLVSEEQGNSILVQFQLLYSAYFKVSLTTRSILLSTFLKFVLKYPSEDFIPEVVDLLEIEARSIDLELQTRAFEYLKLITDSSNLKMALLGPFPIYKKKKSPLMNRLGSVNMILNRNRSTSSVTALKINLHGNMRSRSSSTLQVNKTSNEGDVSDANPFEEKATTKTKIVLSPNWYGGYHRMLQYDAGIFFENQLIKITYRIIKEDSKYLIKFTVINNVIRTTGEKISSLKIIDLESNCESSDPSYIVDVTKYPDTDVTDKTNIEVSVVIRKSLKDEESPVLSLCYICGGTFQQLNLKFPVVLIKSISPTLGLLEDFKKRWLQVGELLGTKGEYSISIISGHSHSSSNISRLLSRLGFSVVFSTSDEDSKGVLVMGGGILHTQKMNYGLLLTIKSTSSLGKQFNLVVRSTGEGISERIGLTMKELFEDNV